MGVAVSVSTSTSARRRLSASFCRTPKRCSSSMIASPRRASFTPRDRSLCVPITMSISPVASCARMAEDSFTLRKRESSAIFTGQSAKRSVKVW